MLRSYVIILALKLEYVARIFMSDQDQKDYSSNKVFLILKCSIL